MYCGTSMALILQQFLGSNPVSASRLLCNVGQIAPLNFNFHVHKIELIIISFLNSFHIHLLSIYYVPGTELRTEDAAVNKPLVVHSDPPNE